MSEATWSIIGTVVTPTGLTQHADALGRVNDVCWTPAAAYKREQPADLPIHLDHDTTWTIGRTVYLERDAAHGLTAVATIDADLALDATELPWFFSDGITSRKIGDSLLRYGIELRELSLVGRTANVANRPLWFTRGDVTRGASAPRGVPLWVREKWDRAKVAAGARRLHRAGPLVIHDVDERDAYDEAIADPDGLRRAIREHRRASEQHRRLAAVAALASDSRVYRHRLGGSLIDPTSGT